MLIRIGSCIIDRSNIKEIRATSFYDFTLHRFSYCIDVIHKDAGWFGMQKKTQVSYFSQAQRDEEFDKAWKCLQEADQISQKS
jgi:hypothetical protein